ncbi:MAG: homoserine dehydrogenase [Gammaproteobacteria bacterium]
MLAELQYREKSGAPIQVGLIGAGAMGLGIAWQIARTPGMELSFVADLNIKAAEKAQEVYGKPVKLFTNADEALEDSSVKLDVLVESSNSIGAATRYCLKAIQRKAHVVLMNAEVDLVMGPYLQNEADKHGVVVTSDAGDQHGVLMRMIEEIQMWGFDIMQAGNIKGFLDRYATSDSKREIAKKLNLNLIQCVAYTDGTKLNIEMALIANGAGLTPFTPGMEGPKAAQVTEALDLFNFDAYQDQGRVDYILGAEPGGGVYVVGRCDDRFQADYMKYYKVHSRYPYYLFYRPYHLCHLETPRAIALAALWGKAVLKPTHGLLTDVYARAKQPLKSDGIIAHGIGGDEVYGLIQESRDANAQGYLPIGLLDTESGADKPRLKRALEKDEPIRWEDVEMPESSLLTLFKQQQELLKKKETVAS